MAEETATTTVPAEAEKMEEVSAPSTSAEQANGDDVDTEANRLMGMGHRHLVMKDVRAAVNAFQEASSLLGKKYGETADQCADAFYYYGMALLDLARMENNVLGNALEGMPEEEDEEGEKEDPNIPSASNLDEKEREQLREQVYDAMAEKEEKSDKENGGDSKEPKAEESKAEEMECEKSSEAPEAKEPAEGKAAEVEKATEEAETKPEASSEAEEKAATEAASDEKMPTEEKNTTDAVSEEKKDTKAADEEKNTEAAEKSKTEAGEADSTQGSDEKPEEKPKVAEDSEAAAKPDEAEAKTDEAEAKPDASEEKEDKTNGDEEAEPMEGDEEEEESDDNEETEEKENEEEEVGNLQLAWEMLDLSKIIFKRQQDKAAQLKAAQAHLKLGEVSIESENYTQAVEDFLACLNIQKEHLEEHDRLLAETHYQLGLAYQYNSKHEDAISHFTQSIDVIEKRMVVLTEQLEKAAEESKEETQKEMDELKGLLPDIKEKIEDSKEAQKSAEDTDKALKETLGGTSGFPQENGGTSKSAAAEKSGDSTVPVTNCVSDISHLVRKKRKPEEESPLKEAKKSKPDPVENGSGNGDAVVPTNEQADKAEEAENQTPMETAAVESTA